MKICYFLTAKRIRMVLILLRGLFRYKDYAVWRFLEQMQETANGWHLPLLWFREKQDYFAQQIPWLHSCIMITDESSKIKIMKFKARL
jgi:hypothetical protein